MRFVRMPPRPPKRSSQPQELSPKLRFELIPARPMQELAQAFTVGARKHGDTAWLDSPKPVSHHVGALLRHLYAFLCGEIRDTDGQQHLASVAARALMIIELLERKNHAPVE